MADDVPITPASGLGVVPVAADEIAGVKHQRVKVQHGADGSATDVSAASPLPVTATSDRGAATFSGSHTTSGTPSTSNQVRPANAARKEVEIVNISDATVYLGFGGAAVIEAGIPLTPGSGYYSERSTEQITSICAVASKKLTVLER
jgi:hypothetical protein